MVKDHGEGMAHAWIALVLEEVDGMVGSRTPPGTIAMWGRMLIQQYGHRSVESVCLAIREGMTRKVYGALTYPQIAEWMNDHEAAILALTESEAARHKFTGDNLGRDYLDRAERESKDGVIRRQRSLIDALRSKLTNDQNTNDHA